MVDFVNIPLLLAQNDAPPASAAPTTGAPAASGAPGSPGSPVAASPTGTSTAAPGGATTSPSGAQGGASMFSGLIWIIPLLIFFFIMMNGPQKKEKKKKEAMLAALKKGDRVQTIGGILGVVNDVRNDEVVIKVDDNTNTRMRFARSAIHTVLSEGAPSE